jgi:hypoxanthine phosphoribosyltransferase
MGKVYVTWEDIDNYINRLVENLNEKGIKPSGVYAPPRGGLIFATLLSYKMDIPLLLNASKNCIIIDDIADSGRTLQHFTENDTQFNKYYITTMYYHPRSTVIPDFYMHEKNDEWIVFPYEYEV